MTDINKYRETPEAFTDGQESREDAVDASGNKKATIATAFTDTNHSIASFNDHYTPKYQAAASADVVVKAAPGYLKGIIVGKWVANATIEVSDHASDGDGNVQVFLTMNATNVGAFPKYIPIGAYFATGICADQLLATQVTYIYR